MVFWRAYRTLVQRTRVLAICFPDYCGVETNTCVLSSTCRPQFLLLQHVGGRLTAFIFVDVTNIKSLFIVNKCFINFNVDVKCAII